MFSELLKSPILQKDLLEETDDFRAKKKLEVYYENERIYKTQYYVQAAYNHLIKDGYIQIDENMNYYYFPNESIFFHLGLNKKCQGFNIVGDALTKTKAKIIVNEANSLFKGWYVIEMFVDLFCRRSESKYANDYTKITAKWEDLFFQKVSIDEIYDRLEKNGIIHFDECYIKEWFDKFDYKSWKHYFIFEYNQKYPNTFLPFIKKWYASSSYYFDNQNILTILKKSIINRCNVENTDLMDSKDMEDNLLALFNEKKMNLSDDDKIKIEKLKFEKYTTYEIKKMQKFLPDMKIHKNMYYIYDNDKLSPLYKHYFTIESKKFVNVMQYIFYKLLCQIETVNKAYNLINKNSNYEKVLDDAIERFFAKQKLKNTVFTSIDNIILKKDNEESKRIFVKQFTIYYNIYKDDFDDKTILHKFIDLFYSHMQNLLVNEHHDIVEYMNNFLDFDAETVQLFYNIMFNFEINNFELLKMILKLEKNDINIIYTKAFTDIITIFKNKDESCIEYKDIKNVMEYKDYLEIKKIEIKFNS